MRALRRHITARSLSLAAFVALGALLFGGVRDSRAEEPAPATKADAPAVAEIVIGEETRITDVLKSLARITGTSITWSDQDRAVSTKKILASGTTVRGTVEQVFDTVRAMLANEEILLMRYGPSETPMFVAMDARTLASQFIMKAQPDVIEVTDAMIPKLLSQSGRFVTTTVRVSNLTELRDVRTALQRIITQNNIGSVQEVPAARAFIVTDFAPNVAAVYRIVRQMDVPPTPVPTAEAKKMSPAYFMLKHASARRVATVLGELFPPKPNAPAMPATQAGSSAAASAEPSPRISAEEESNQVIVIANPEDIATMREIVRHVDVEPAK